MEKETMIEINNDLKTKEYCPCCNEQSVDETGYCLNCKELIK